MKKKISFKFLIISISLISLCSAGIIIACGWNPGDEWRYRFLSQEVSHAEKYQPFFHSVYPFYDSMEPNPITDYNDISVREWYNFFLKKVDYSDVSYLLYKSTLGEIDDLLAAMKNEKLPIPVLFKNFSILKYPNRDVVVLFLTYLDFAKRCEIYAVYTPEWSWNADYQRIQNYNPRNQVKTIDSMVNTGMIELQLAKGPFQYQQFVYQRYLFQIVRLYFLESNFEQCYSFYQKIADFFTINNTIKYRTMEYAAGALNKMKQYSKANYMFSVIYDQCDVMKKTAYLDFHPQDESDWQDCLTLAKNTREKTVLWCLLGIYHDPLRAMKEIYSIDPASDLLDILLVRAVNAEEGGFLPERYSFKSEIHEDSSNSNQFIDHFIINPDKVNSNLVDFIGTVAKNENTNKPYLWNLCAGYLMLAKHQFAEADRLLSKSLEKATNDTLLGEQIRLLKVVSEIEQMNKPNATFESTIVKELKWLNGMSHQKALKNRDAYEWALKKLSIIYARQNEPVKSICLNPDNKTFYSDTSNLMNLVNLINVTDKSEFDQYLVEIFPFQKKEIYEIKAVILIYNNDLQGAYKVFKGCDGSGSRELIGDPFVTAINDCNQCNYDTNKSIRYTKIDFVKKMIYLQNKAEKDPKNSARYYFIMANGFYNITYFGT